MRFREIREIKEDKNERSLPCSPYSDSERPDSNGPQWKETDENYKEACQIFDSLFEDDYE